MHHPLEATLLPGKIVQAPSDSPHVQQINTDLEHRWRRSLRPFITARVRTIVAEFTFSRSTIGSNSRDKQDCRLKDRKV
jgi:hypothetical protein